VTVEIDDHYLGQWVARGMAQVDSHLEAYAEFHRWLAEYRPDLLPCGRRCRLRQACRVNARPCADATPTDARISSGAASQATR
jgi:hypothetical protein